MAMARSGAERSARRGRHSMTECILAGSIDIMEGTSLKKGIFLASTGK